MEREIVRKEELSIEYIPLQMYRRNALRPVYSDTTQLNSTSSWVQLCRYKRAFTLPAGSPLGAGNYDDTSSSVSGAAFILVTVKHALAPVGRLPAVGPTSHQIHAGPRLVQVWTALTPQRRIRQDEARSTLHWQKFRVVCSNNVSVSKTSK